MKSWIYIYGLLTLLKLLCMCLYKSTDYEVHRNWLAITYSLPISEWYFESTSKWTLDYPPFFAYFEWFLSQIAYGFGFEEAIKISAEPYEDVSFQVFHRVTVIVSDLVYLYACYRLVSPY